MEKYCVKCKQTRIAYLVIEQESAEDAVRIVSDRLKYDDYFCDSLYELYENGVMDEEITASRTSDDARVDYYEMIGEEEEK